MFTVLGKWGCRTPNRLNTHTCPIEFCPVLVTTTMSGSPSPSTSPTTGAVNSIVPGTVTGHIADHRIRIPPPVEQNGEAAHRRAVVMVGEEVIANIAVRTGGGDDFWLPVPVQVGDGGRA